MYKEKYLKYKTKYLDLQSQLGGNPNIIQEGGVWVWPFTSSANKPPPPPPPPPPPKPTSQSTIESAIEQLKFENMFEAKQMTMDEYESREETNELRIPWSSDQTIVDTWNSIYGKIIFTGKITDISNDLNYKINITLDDGTIAIITMPDGFINYNENIYSMYVTTGEIKRLTIALAIQTLTDNEMFIPPIKMTMYEYNKRVNNKEPFILWSDDQEIINIWNSVYNKINTGTIEDIFLKLYKIRINLDGKKTAIISIPSGSFDYIETILMPDESIEYKKTSYFMDLRTGQITKSSGA
jgi:hypothetical protein